MTKPTSVNVNTAYEAEDLIPSFLAVNFPGIRMEVERTDHDEVTVYAGTEEVHSVQSLLESVFGEFANDIDRDFQNARDSEIQADMDDGIRWAGSYYSSKRICWKEENGNLHHALTSFHYSSVDGETDDDYVSSMSFIPSGAKIVGVVEFYPVNIVCVESKLRGQ